MGTKQTYFSVKKKQGVSYGKEQENKATRDSLVGAVSIKTTEKKSCKRGQAAEEQPMEGTKGSENSPQWNYNHKALTHRHVTH